jgi:hypothetical protein
MNGRADPLPGGAVVDRRSTAEECIDAVCADTTAQRG